jgi:hypothetical protein
MLQMFHIKNRKLTGGWLENFLFVASKILIFFLPFSAKRTSKYLRGTVPGLSMKTINYLGDYVKVDEAVIDKR